MTVPEAAAALGVSQDAIRARIKRGTLPVERASGRVYVLLKEHVGGDLDGDQPRPGRTDQSELVAELRDQVRYLREQLQAEKEARTEERRRHDTIVAQLTSRIPAIEAPSEPPGGPETVPEMPMGPEPSEAREEAREEQKAAQPRSSTPDRTGAMPLCAGPAPPHLVA